MDHITNLLYEKEDSVYIDTKHHSFTLTFTQLLAFITLISNGFFFFFFPLSPPLLPCHLLFPPVTRPNKSYEYRPCLHKRSVKDLSKSLSTTPLLINPVSTAPVYTEGDPSNEYFIDVKFIRVGGTRLGSFNTSLLAIDKMGRGGTKLSTITPYTILHTSIYQALVNKFVKTATSKKIKRVASVSPFGACFDSKTIGNASTGPDVLIIDLVLQKGVYWRIYGANSMVGVKKGTVLCLGFVDGGAKTRTLMVLGGHQLENYLLEFDLSSSVLGFSSSLLVHNTSCSHYRIF